MQLSIAMNTNLYVQCFKNNSIYYDKYMNMFRLLGYSLNYVNLPN
jgi:hypothetical protein